MTLEKLSHCKINLVLNILGKRADGFHELETVMQPVPLHDHLQFESTSSGKIELTCSDPRLPCDAGNLVMRAAALFFKQTGLKPGARIHLEKKIPMAAGLGGGSGNAAATLLGLNELFDSALSRDDLESMASALGSDVPFFLQSNPALATGRGEKVEPVKPFKALQNTSLLLVHPGFGISTPWAYQQLAHFPEGLNGRPGRAAWLIQSLNGLDLPGSRLFFFNSLELPALKKYPVLRLYQEFFLEQGAAVALMSGSGSTTFALFSRSVDAERALEQFSIRFGTQPWRQLIQLQNTGQADPLS